MRAARHPFSAPLANDVGVDAVRQGNACNGGAWFGTLSKDLLLELASYRWRVFSLASFMVFTYSLGGHHRCRLDRSLQGSDGRPLPVTRQTRIALGPPLIISSSVTLHIEQASKRPEKSHRRFFCAD